MKNIGTVYNSIIRSCDYPVEISRNALRREHISLHKILNYFARKGYLFVGCPEKYVKARQSVLTKRKIINFFRLTKDPYDSIFQAVLSKRIIEEPYFIGIPAQKRGKREYKISDMSKNICGKGLVLIVDASRTMYDIDITSTDMSSAVIAYVPVSPDDFNMPIEMLPVRDNYSERRFRIHQIRDIVNICLGFYHLACSTHGSAHIRKCVEYARQIALVECPDQVNDAILGAALHDIGRGINISTAEHSLRGSKMAKSLIAYYWPKQKIEDIVFAIRHHADGMISSNSLIGTIWDADRLDLGRCGRRVKSSLLSTEMAKLLL